MRALTCVLICIFAFAAEGELIYGEKEVKECSQAGTGRESCFWSFMYSSEMKTNKLLIYFSGGQMSCPNITSPASTFNYMVQAVNDGYMSVCARTFNDSVASGRYPYNQESGRLDSLLAGIFQDEVTTQVWTGENLLISGVSHGATSPVIAMFRTTADDTWIGSNHTAACFFDGEHNINTDLEIFYSNQCSEANSVLSYQRAFSRYCAWDANATDEDPSTWPLPSSCATADTALDAVDGIFPTTDLAVRVWKVVECGSSMEVCNYDVLNMAAQQKLCSNIDLSEGYSCVFESHPTVSHSKCGADTTTIHSCTSWFDTQL